MVRQAVECTKHLLGSDGFVWSRPRRSVQSVIVTHLTPTYTVDTAAARRLLSIARRIRQNMSKPSYQALLQSLDETDVAIGLGRSVKLNSRRNGCCRRFCCCCCCRPPVAWICLIFLIMIGLAISIGVPYLLVSYPSSVASWKQWFQYNWSLAEWTSLTPALNRSTPAGLQNLTESTTVHVYNDDKSAASTATPTPVTPPSWTQNATEFMKQIIHWTVES